MCSNDILLVWITTKIVIFGKYLNFSFSLQRKKMQFIGLFYCVWWMDDGHCFKVVNVFLLTYFFCRTLKLEMFYSTMYNWLKVWSWQTNREGNHSNLSHSFLNYTPDWGKCLDSCARSTLWTLKHACQILQKKSKIYQIHQRVMDGNMHRSVEPKTPSVKNWE